ncbi:anthranilate/para-aminobenzoate synthase component I [Mycetocola sp. CAN_C7]|uniref:anthranilate synthase component I family protein n=1 Tax=Mycetocola sp. CAN_C7 TaxID=2787724 RepID=UPI001A2AD4F9
MDASVPSRRLTAWVDPQSAFLALFAESDRAFWLDSGVAATSGFSYLGDGVDLLTASVDDLTVGFSRSGGSASRSPGTIFDALRQEIAGQQARVPAGQFSPGWVGWIGYEAGARSTGTPSHPSRYPDAAFIRPARMLVFDHAARTVTALETAHSSPGPSVSRPFGWLSALAGLPDPDDGAARLPEKHVARWRHSPTDYATLIDEAQAEIRAGNAYQLCLTNEVVVDGEFDPVEVYLRLRQASPSHHGGLLRCDGVALVSSSPEQFLTVSPDGAVTTRPIKGTRPRGSTPEADSALEAELLGSEKERAENLMIVDLMRNDLGRVAVTGSVSVTQLLAVESYAQVHQLVSTVTASLAPGISGVDAVESAFPAGSMTGAPKLSAMTILDRLEAGPRGVYSGAFGYLGADGAVDLAMVIRSILIDGTGASVGTGGGITALSVAAEEIEETRIKAAALLAALGVVEQ